MPFSGRKDASKGVTSGRISGRDHRPEFAVRLHTQVPTFCQCIGIRVGCGGIYLGQPLDSDRSADPLSQRTYFFASPRTLSTSAFDPTNIPAAWKE